MEYFFHTNFDLQKIFTPVRAYILNRLLKESQYPEDKCKYLIHGFTHSFSLEYRGDRKVRFTSRNLRLTVGNKG